MKALILGLAISPTCGDLNLADEPPATYTLHLADPVRELNPETGDAMTEADEDAIERDATEEAEATPTAGETRQTGTRSSASTRRRVQRSYTPRFRLFRWGRR